MPRSVITPRSSTGSTTVPPSVAVVVVMDASVGECTTGANGSARNLNTRLLPTWMSSQLPASTSWNPATLIVHSLASKLVMPPDAVRIVQDLSIREYAFPPPAPTNPAALLFSGKAHSVDRPIRSGQGFRRSGFGRYSCPPHPQTSR